MGQDTNLNRMVKNLDPKLYLKIKILALQSRRTIAEELNHAMAEYVERHTINLK